MASRMEDWIDKIDQPVEEFDRDITELRRSLDVFDRQLRLMTVNMVRFSRAMQTSTILAAGSNLRAGGGAGVFDNRQFSTSLAGLGTAIAANTAATSAQAAAIAANTATLRSLSLFAGATAAARTTTTLTGIGASPMAPGAGGLYPRSNRPVPPVPLRPIDDEDDQPQVVRRNEAEMRASETPEQTKKREDNNAKRRTRDQARREAARMERQRLKDLNDAWNATDWKAEVAKANNQVPLPGGLQPFNTGPAAPSTNMAFWNKTGPGHKAKLRLPPPGNLLPTGMGDTATSPEIQTVEQEMAEAEAAYKKQEEDYTNERIRKFNEKLDKEKVTDPDTRAKRHEGSANAAKGAANKRAAAHQAKIEALKAQIAQLRQQAQQTAAGTASTQGTPSPAVPMTSTPQLANTTTPVPGLPTPNLPPIPIPGGLPPIGKPPTPPQPPWFPLFPPGGGGGGGGRGRGGSGGGQGPGFGQLFQGSISILVLALKENTLATRLNTITMNRMRLDQMKGKGPNLPTSPDPDDDRNRGWVGLTSTMNAIASATATASAAMLGFTALADPSTFSTFTGSVKLLGSAIGEMFAPVVKDAAFAIQDWRDAINGLDPETKSNIVTIGKWVLGVGLAVTALRALGSATLVTTAAVGAFNLIWRFSPFGAVITALATISGLAYAAAEAFGVFGAKAQESGRKAANAVNEVNPQGPNVGLPAERNLAQLRGDLPIDIQQKLDATKNKKEREDVLAAEKARIEKEITVEKQRLPEGLPTAQKKFDIIAPAAKELQQLFKDQLENYNWANQTKSSTIPGWAPQHDTVTNERIRLMKQVSEKAQAQGIKLTQEDWDIMMPKEEMKGWGPWANRQMAGFPQVPERPNQMLPGERNVKRLEGVLGTVEAFAKAVAGQKDKIEDIVLPGGVQARYTDAVSYRESVQLAGLNKVDTQTELLQDQLRNLAASKVLLTEIKDYQAQVAAALRNAKPVVGK